MKYLKFFDYAYDETLKLIMDLKEYFPNNFPNCEVILDATGGICLFWENTELDREVEVLIGATPERGHSIYYVGGLEDAEIIKPFTTEQLVGFLTWLGYNPINSL